MESLKVIGSLGDVNPLEHGGLIVTADEGNERFQGHKIQVSEENDEWTVYTFDLDYVSNCSAEWFGRDLPSVCAYVDMDLKEMCSAFRSSNILERAQAYEAVGDYFGYLNLDSYPEVYSGKQGKKTLKKRFKI